MISLILPHSRIGRREAREGGGDKGLSQNSQTSEPKNQTGHGDGRGKGEKREGVRHGEIQTVLRIFHSQAETHY